MAKDTFTAHLSAGEYASKEAQRQRSEMKNRAIANHEIALAKAEMRITNLEEFQEKIENTLDGGSLGLGLISTTLSQGREIADLRIDFEKYCREQCERKSFNLQRLAIVIGLVAAIIGGATQPVIQYANKFIHYEIKANR